MNNLNLKLSSFLICLQLYSRGMFTGSGAQPTGGQTTATITVQTTKDMSPSSVLIVYGFDGSTGEMLISSKRFSVTGILKNQVKLKLYKRNL